MSKTTIRGTVTHTVSLGTYGIQDTLTVTGTGLVLPQPVPSSASTYGQAGVEVRPRLSNASITNEGTISGGAGGIAGGMIYDTGGAGIVVSGIGTSIANRGLIRGGAGATLDTTNGLTAPAGGTGIDLVGDGTMLANRGLIEGGSGGNNTGNGDGGAGGIGIRLTAAGTLTNFGTISGGGGGNASSSGKFGPGGVGVDLSSSGAAVVNFGMIEGGSDSGISDSIAQGADVSNGALLVNDGTVYGVVAVTGAVLKNNDTISAGSLGVAVGLQSGATLINRGSIGSYHFHYHGGGAENGAIGVSLGKETTLVNSGDVAGGNGIGSDYQYGSGGIGVYATSAAEIANSGLIEGGSTYRGFNDGGNGVELRQGGTLTSSGTISGGDGILSGYGVLANDANVTNTGTIAAGDAYSPNHRYYGGAGVEMNGGSLFNAGVIDGGGTYFGHGIGGIGVVLNGATLTTDGIITGGLNGSQLAISAYNSTVIVDPGAVFVGTVAAYPNTGTLELGGKSAGRLGGIGMQFTGFGTVAEAAGADWTLTQANMLVAAASFLDSGLLSVAGSLDDAGTAKILTGGELNVTSGGTALLNNLVLLGGSLSALSGGLAAVGDSSGGLIAGDVTVEAGASINGYGGVNAEGMLIDDGTIVAREGTLSIDVPVTGFGALDIANGATLQMVGASSVASLGFIAGADETLTLGAPKSFDSTISGFASSDTIDLKGTAANALSFSAGTLTLYDSGSAVDSLAFAGPYIQADFMIGSDGQGGTNIHYSGSEENARLSPDRELSIIPFPNEHNPWHI